MYGAYTYLYMQCKGKKSPDKHLGVSVLGAGLPGGGTRVPLEPRNRGARKVAFFHAAADSSLAWRRPDLGYLSGR